MKRAKLPAKILFLASLAMTFARAFALDDSGRDFVGVSSFTSFQREQTNGSVVLTSPVFDARVSWNELVVSWNVHLAERDALKIEARAIHDEGPSPYYVLGVWSTNTNRARGSVRGQKDDSARVETDILLLKKKSRKTQVRLSFASAETTVKFLGLSFLDGDHPLATNRMAASATRILPVPERSQMLYPGGSAWCSPTSTSMVLAYWGNELTRPELVQEVPVVAAAVDDPNWPGTGNWPFNTAYAGSFEGMRAYVTRLADVSEIKVWIEAGVPVVASVAYGVLKGTQRKDGHLIVVVGFNEKGEIIVNDPGTRLNVRKAFPLANFRRAWAHSRNTVYLIYPENKELPTPANRHWELREKQGQGRGVAE